jgi:3-oxoadipate enol-lactonase
MKNTVLTEGIDLKLSFNNFETSYNIFGDGKIPVIFIHGFPFDKSTWQPQMDFLSKTNRVIAYDIRGFGKSTINEEEESIGLFADDLILFMDALNIDKAIVCGLSMGGYILLNAANKYPNRFSGIILSDTQCIADTAEIKEKRNETISKINDTGINDFTDSFIENIFCDKTLELKKDIVEKVRNIILSAKQQSIIRTLGVLAQRSETCADLSKIKIPTLIICGREDKVTPLEQSKFLNGSIPNSILNIIDDAGHLSNLEQPEQFNKTLKKFIVKLEN